MARYKSILLIIFVLTLLPALSFAGDTGKRDFAAHFAVSAIFGGLSETVLHKNTELSNSEKIFYGTAIGTIPGLAKEIADSVDDNNHFDGLDMVANITGAFSGAVLSNLINNRLSVRTDFREDTKKVYLSYKF